MKKTSMPIYTIMILLLAFAVVQVQSSLAEEVKKSQITKVVYLYNSDACACEQKRNVAAEEIMKSVMKDSSRAIVVERIDGVQKPEEMVRYEDNVGFAFLPALIALDAEGKAVKKVEGFFTEEKIREILIK